MKKFIAVLLSALLIFSLAACSGEKDKPTNEQNESVSSADKLKDITIALDWTPNTNHTGLFVAAAKGYYKDAGLNVTIVQAPETASSLMCASGKAQFAIEFQDTLAAAFSQDEPLEVTAVAAVLQHNTSGIMSRKGEGIDRPKGLEGKTYSTWDNPIEQAIIKSAMEEDGGDFSKVKLITNNITDEAGALSNHDTDAVWIFYGWSGIAAKLKGFEFDYFDFVTHNPDVDYYNPVFDYYTPVIIANNSFLKSDPDTARAFLKATSKGYEYAVKNPEESAQILIDGDTTGSLKDSKELVTESQKWLSGKYIDDAEKWGVIDQERWDRFYSWLWENKLISNELKPGAGMSMDYLS